MQRIEMNPMETQGWILDIGGGGEGIVGQLNGRQVVAIDTSQEALEETQNDVLKAVMDAPTSDSSALPLIDAPHFSLCCTSQRTGI
jgi:hypothetical protein